MTRKFKIGDKVRLSNSRVYSDVKNGDVGIITGKQSGDGWLLVDVAGQTKGLREIDNRWELVEQSWKERMTK